MLTADVRVEDFDASDWIALRDVFAPRPRPEAGSDARAGGLILVVDGERVVKGTSTGKGRLEPSSLVGPLDGVARAQGARWALRIERGALPELLDRFARRSARGDDSLRQAAHLVSALRELCDEGLAETWPRDVRALPQQSERVVLRALDAVCGVGKTILVAAFDGTEVVTSLALHRGEKGFDRIVGPRKARHEMGLVSSDWARNCRGLGRAVELGVGPVALGCFAQAETFRGLLGDTSPGAWASAVAGRDVLFQPMPAALAIPIGIDVGRVAVGAARDLATRFGFGSWFAAGGAVDMAMGRMKEAASSGEVERVLGFDPVAVLRALFGGAHTHADDSTGGGAPSGPADSSSDSEEP